MKKFIALLLSILCLSAPVLAEEVNFDDMDLAALLALHEKLDAAIQEQMDCVLDGDNIYQGVYVVGQDIKPGRYLLTSLSKTYFMCHLYQDQEHKAAHDGGQHETLLSIGDTLSIKFEEGMVFVVDQGVVSVKMISDPEWAP